MKEIPLPFNPTEFDPNDLSGHKTLKLIEANSQYIREMAGSREWVAAIVIPALNEERRLPLCLASVNEALARIPDIPTQVLLVDNGSTDATSQIAEAFGARVIFESEKGIGRARQKGLLSLDKRVKHVVTTDADVIVDPEMVGFHIGALSQAGVVGSYGRVYDRFEGEIDPLDRVLLYLFQIIGDKVHDYKRLRKGIILSIGNNSAYSREAALRVGGYESRYSSEDLEIMLKLKSEGEIKFVPDAIVYPSARRFTTSKNLRRHILDRLVFNLKTRFSAQIELSDVNRPDYR
ncbi:MAG: Glycosyl transferase family 2 [Candidatus Woesebacteria bacterium GW2011_GWA1_39_8]|nr:MAG: Glycosyl transferase family 2 [Candidatus Woesebacteria bacterium GW2011_GWA1_39_8]